MLKIRGLQKNYGKFRALDGLDMDVETGALYGLAGPNGAGKTTTMRILTGLLLPDGGSVEIDGISAVGKSKRLKEKIGYVPDEIGVYDNLKVSEYMEFFASCYGLVGLVARKRAMTLLEQVGLSGREDSYVDSLSRGMKQRLCLARALLHSPELLVMDEPMAGLDPRTKREFRSMLLELNEQGETIIISSHILQDLSELCSDIGIINEGKMVIQGPTEELLDQAQDVKPLIISVYEDRAKALEILRGHPLVETISIRDQEIVVGFHGSTREESELLTELTNAGVLIRSFMRDQGSLESIFMQLTSDDDEKVVLSYEAESGL